MYCENNTYIKTSYIKTLQTTCVIRGAKNEIKCIVESVVLFKYFVYLIRYTHICVAS